MSLITLSEIISVAKENNKAVGAFSVGNIKNQGVLIYEIHRI